MPTTFYSSADLGNVTLVGSLTLVNCVDIGSAPFNPNFGGSFSDISYHKTVDEIQENRCEVGGIWTADVNHSTPPGAIHPNAHIRKVTIRMQFTGNANQASINALFANGNPSPFPNVQTNSTVIFSISTNPTNSLWVSDSHVINVTDSETVTDGVNLSSSSIASPASAFVFKEYDFMVNPNGDFPLGYMDYATFVVKYSKMVFAISSFSSVRAAWGIAQPPTATIDGTDAGSCSLQATNWVMEVEWELPTSWTLEPTPVTYPDNVVTITRPAPIIGEGDEDTEQIEKIQIGNTIIEPNDPWVIIWTTLTIKIHLPTDEKYDPDPEIKLFFVGTEFSGAVSSIPLTIIYADLSGIYQLDDSIHHDVLYERTATPTTQNVLIPAPFFVTHLVDTPETDISHYAGTRIGIIGQGTAKQVFQSDDYIQTLQFGDVVLRTSNNKSPFSLANFTDQHASLRVYMDSLDDFMRVDKIVIFTKPVFTGYPQ